MAENPEFQSNSPKQKSMFTAASNQMKLFNLNAQPFFPRFITKNDQITVGPSQVPVNAKIWQSIASTRALPQIGPITNSMSSGNSTDPPGFTFFSPEPFNSIGLANSPPPFECDNSRNVIFRRVFGPVALDEGYIEIRLHFGVRILISLDHSVLIENGDIRIGVSGNCRCSAMTHPNGQVYHSHDKVDIVAYDGLQKNSFVRYAKIWRDCVSLTANGLALTYLVDTAGTRTTSDAVNYHWTKDYCMEVFMDDFKLRNQYEVMTAATHYHYKIEEDGTEVFMVCGVRIAQAQDGMIRVSHGDRLSVRTSVENRSVTLKTPYIHCTASMGNSPHLFVRYNERRVHFDGSNFVVRNMGHSASFDGNNLLRIH